MRESRVDRDVETRGTHPIINTRYYCSDCQNEKEAAAKSRDVNHIMGIPLETNVDVEE